MGEQSVGRRKLTPGLVSRLASGALVGIFVLLGFFVVALTYQGQQTRHEVARAQELSAAYSEAQLAVAEAEAAAHRFQATEDPAALTDFNNAVAATEAAVGRIMVAGGPQDRQLVVGLFREFVPALSAAETFFAADGAGRPDPATLPDPRAPQALRDRLAGPAAAQSRLATDLDTAYGSQQERYVWFALGVSAAGIVLVVALLLAARAFGRRELVASSQLAYLRKAAFTDGLTELGNRRSFEEELAAQVTAAVPARKPLALAILDVDEFKAVNDTWGHERGDGLLRALADSLRTECRSGDRLFRIGGDEFAVIFPATGVAAAMAIVDRVRARLARQSRGETTLSAGVAELSPGCDDDTLLRQEADAALYEAKLRGRNLAVGFDAAAGVATLVSGAKLQGLRRLLADRCLAVHYQPICDMRTGQVLAYEALARIDAAYGLDGAMDAFQLAERAGRVAELDTLCRDRALDGAAQLPPGADLFINVSPFTLAHASFSAEAFRARVEEAGIAPERVVLEITERSPVPVEVIARAARALRSEGFRVALDDVGTGNNGLEMLQAVQVDFVKVDAAIVRSAIVSGASRAALMAIVVFAAEAGALVVAEGIEDDQMLDLVKGLSSGPAWQRIQLVHGVQGYLLGRPVAGFGGPERQRQAA